MNHDTTPEGWEKEFEEGYQKTWHDHHLEDHAYAELKQFSKSFIRQLLTRTREEAEQPKTYSIKKLIAEAEEKIREQMHHEYESELAAREQKGRDEAVDYICKKYPESTKEFPHLEATRRLFEEARSPRRDVPANEN